MNCNSRFLAFVYSATSPPQNQSVCQNFKTSYPIMFHALVLLFVKRLWHSNVKCDGLIFHSYESITLGSAAPNWGSPKRFMFRTKIIVNQIKECPAHISFLFALFKHVDVGMIVNSLVLGHSKTRSVRWPANWVSASNQHKHLVSRTAVN